MAYLLSTKPSRASPARDVRLSVNYPRSEAYPECKSQAVAAGSRSIDAHAGTANTLPACE
jgi:hypothetical protein